MMKSLALCVALLLLLPTLAWPQGRVGYVDIDRITGKAKQISSVMSDMEDTVKQMQQEMKEKLQRVRELEGDIKRTEGVFSKEEQDKKRKEIDRLRNELDELEYQAKKKMKELDSTVVEPMLKKILFAIQDVAREKKFDLVLRGEAVLYGGTAVDITDDVIRKLNQDTGTTSSKRMLTPKDETGLNAKPSADSQKEATGSGAKASSAERSAKPPKADVSESEKTEPTPEAGEQSANKSEPPQSAGKSESAPKKSEAPAKRTRPVDRQPD